MGKNGGGQLTDSILTLEEALVVSSPRRLELAHGAMGEGVSDSGVRRSSLPSRSSVRPNRGRPRRPAIWIRQTTARVFRSA